MTELGEGDIRPQTYDLEGVEVLSEVVSVDGLEDGARVFRVRSSCKSPRWGTRKQVNSLTSYCRPHQRTEELSLLEQFRQKMARDRVSAEHGQASPPLRFLGVRVGRPDGGKQIQCIASVDLRTGPTRMMREMVVGLDLPLAGRQIVLATKEEEFVRIPLYRATIRYGTKEVISDVLPTEMNLPCVLGGEFIQDMVRERIELVYELLDSEHWRALRNVARSKKTTVLLIGKYGDNTDRLKSLQAEITKCGYDGVLLQDFPDIEEQTLPEKMVLLASIARFVVCDDSAPSGHIEELRICADLAFTTAILRPAGKPSTAMQSDIDSTRNHMKVFAYEGSSFADALRAATEWGEAKVQERSAKLDQLYRWRTPESLLP